MVPAYEKNEKVISAKTGEYKALARPKLTFNLKEVTNAKGSVPAPRYMHS